jgi:hypothetical protein
VYDARLMGYDGVRIDATGMDGGGGSTFSAKG